jgi:hypothetical protein
MEIGVKNDGKETNALRPTLPTTLGLGLLATRSHRGLSAYETQRLCRTGQGDDGPISMWWRGGAHQGAA